MRIIIAVLCCIFATTSFAAEFTITSSGFKDNEKIPVKFSCDGSNLSPDLKWTNPPSNTKSYALILTSPDWTTGYVYLWVVYNIPREAYEFAEGANLRMPEEILQGENYYNSSSYRGPCPPDKKPHHYVFTIYALDDVLDLDADEDAKTVMEQIQKHKLGEAKITGIFQH